MRPVLTTLVLSTALLGPAAAQTAGRQPVVPQQFRGEWNATPRHCGTGLNDSRLVIGAGYIKFYESQGEIHAVVARGQNELALIAELSGEGDTWLHYSHFTLSEDGRTLTNNAGGASSMRLQRCPPHPGK